MKLLRSLVLCSALMAGAVASAAPAPADWVDRTTGQVARIVASRQYDFTVRMTMLMGLEIRGREAGGVRSMIVRLNGEELFRSYSNSFIEVTAKGPGRAVRFREPFAVSMGYDKHSNVTVQIGCLVSNEKKPAKEANRYLCETDYGALKSRLEGSDSTAIDKGWRYRRADWTNKTVELQTTDDPAWSRIAFVMAPDADSPGGELTLECRAVQGSEPLVRAPDEDKTIVIDDGASALMFGIQMWGALLQPIIAGAVDKEHATAQVRERLSRLLDRVSTGNLIPKPPPPPFIRKGTNAPAASGTK